MHAPGRLQLHIIERLRPQADAIKSRAQPSVGLFASNRLGISLERDLLKLAGEIRTHGGKNPREAFRREQTRRPAAKISSVESGPSIAAPANLDFAANRASIRLVELRGKNSRMEIAVGALRLAERNLNIKPASHHPKRLTPRPNANNRANPQQSSPAHRDAAARQTRKRKWPASGQVRAG